jgi:hypothetical protein
MLNHPIPKDWNKEANIPVTKCKANMERDNIHPLWKMLNENFNVDHPDYNEQNALRWRCNKELDDVPDGCFCYTSENFEHMFLEFCRTDESWITNETFKRSRDIDAKLRDCEPIVKKKKRMNGEQKHIRYIHAKELVDYIRLNNHVAHLLDEKLLKQELAEKLLLDEQLLKQETIPLS